MIWETSSTSGITNSRTGKLNDIRTGLEPSFTRYQMNYAKWACDSFKSFIRSNIVVISGFLCSSCPRNTCECCCMDVGEGLCMHDARPGVWVRAVRCSSSHETVFPIPILLSASHAQNVQKRPPSMAWITNICMAVL